MNTSSDTMNASLFTPNSCPIIQYDDDDELLHTDEHLFCAEMDCLCHADQERMAQLNSWVQDGTMTMEQAERYYQGQAL
jgi:hypothetical protein